MNQYILPNTARCTLHRRAGRSGGILSAILMLVATLGCAHVQPNYTLTMEGCADRLASALVLDLPAPSLASPMLVAAPVDAVTLEASPFGLSMQELLTTAMARYGARIGEVQLRKVPTINTATGLVFLSRDAKKIRDEHHVGMAVVSYYTLRNQDLIVTSRVVNLTTNHVMSAATVTLRRSTSITGMLPAEEPPVGEKVYEH